MVVKSSTLIITLTEADFPPRGSLHNLALHITVEAMGFRIDRCLVDNGSALNVFLLPTANKLGLSATDLLLSDQTIRTYDNMQRSIKGVVMLNIELGPVKRTVAFQVIDIPASSNLLLGRSWLYEHEAMSSTIHQMVKFVWGDKVVFVYGDSWQMQNIAGDLPVLEIQEDGGDNEIPSFDFFGVIKDESDVLPVKNLVTDDSIAFVDPKSLSWSSTRIRVDLNQPLRLITNPA